MADLDRERPSQAESPRMDYAIDDLTVASSPPARGDSDDLAFFLIQAGSYMEVHGAGFRTDCERVFELGTQLRGEAANWLVGLVEAGATELHNLEHFLLALRLRFENPLTEEKARAALQRLRQGTRSVSDFAAEFHRLASRLRAGQRWS
uniref:Uncharacterized protein n=1 Tax=Sphaerodactylus townsendi TaxID=933632 RepID=A0ACB8G5H6_9SAUR